MRIILLGAPGAGKGTQATILSKELNVPIISTGNILRAAIKDGTPIGLAAKEYMDAGNLVPDDVIIGIVKERLVQDDCENGFILDGVPRTLPQAQTMEDMGIEVDKALSIEVDDDTIIKRMSGRRVCKDCSESFHIISRPAKVDGKCDVCGGELVIRTDDLPETVISRLSVYHRETEPLKGFYEKLGKLTSIENQPTIEETTAVIKKALGI